ncbi:MAG: RsmB/NOP family class I SAM-dependent RNA methyltransferase [Cytophagaceae bacterium]|nr:RsmB/NOP family class I SAM-dependent RNA methyltransferase [Cytophagaceae bacterium]MBL0300166.1 RsmB/NOP family class I SAM-dependent RNA methyltransferase [Cytophagaceae bacterium]
MSKTVKIFPPLINAVKQALNEIFIENRKADKAINGILKSNPKWGSRDRAFIAENTYEIVRNWRLINFIADEDYEKVNYNAIENLTLIGLILNGYQESNPGYFEKIDLGLVSLKLKEAEKDFRIKYSIPDWLDKSLENEIGERRFAELETMSHQAEVFLRVNTLKISKNELLEIFKAKNIEVEEVKEVENALRLLKRQNVFGWEEYKKGFFEVQDAGSQMIAEFLDVKPGERVIDACAGAGGKSLSLAANMKNSGRLIALDVEEHKLLELKKRAKRNGISNIETRLIEGKTIKRQKESADKLLLDVPCTGLGVIRRNPDAKWKLKPEFMEEVKLTQQKILQEYSKMLKIGGKMVYATCSILPSENEKQVEKFLAENKDFELLKDQHIWPSEYGFDGFYMALFERKNS